MIEFISVLLFLVCCLSEGKFIFREGIHYGGRGILHPQRRAPASSMHSVTFSLKLKNLDQLEAILYDVSDPNSVNYGRHRNREEIGNLVKNEEGSNALRDYLRKGGVKITKATPYDELITAEATIAKWETVFDTEFHEFIHEDWEGQVVHRAVGYSLSEEIDEHIEAVFEVVDLPVRLFHRPSPLSKAIESTSIVNPFPNQVSPSFLLKYYAVDTKVGKDHRGSQAILECIGQSLSTADLAAFQTNFHLPPQTLTNWTGGHVSKNACSEDLSDCMEANLDIQYLMAIGQGIPTYSLYNDNCNWLTVVQTLLSMPNLPKVLSMSYASNEAQLSNKLVNSFNTAAQQLGVMGVTLLAGSGNDGVSGFATRKTSDCQYNPQFPAASPFVTAVGATQVNFFLLNRLLYQV
jgi:tripeptidyl-peptidase-1